MVDAEVVRRRLRELDRRMIALSDLRDRGQTAFLTDEGVRAQAERHLQLAIQIAIDVAIHVLAEASAATPETYGGAFAVLADIGVIEPGLADSLRRAAGLRNILVHAYLDVDPERLWEHLMDIDDLRRFAGALETYVSTA
jgi:uncharacterized protein YutE (UPF0331/DUF86 family)